MKQEAMVTYGVFELLLIEGAAASSGGHNENKYDALHLATSHDWITYHAAMDVRRISPANERY